jgi:tetratricopeptide (TPR) repeat protein
MKKTFIIIILCLCTKIVFADNTKTSTDSKLNDLEHTVKQIEANQINYRIEKDLLKETYTNNYEKISLTITLILGLLSILGYLGLKDITLIKKEYEKELNNLRQIQSQFNLKSIEFDSEKKKVDDELKLIIKENDEQSRKIKFIELKEKISNLLKENNLSSALEFSNAALEISPSDSYVLNQKGRILCRLNQIKDAVQVYEKALNDNPKDSLTILNTTECWYFAKEIDKAKKLISENKSLFDHKSNGNLITLFEIFDKYYESNKLLFLEKIKELVDDKDLKSMKKLIQGWDLKEALYFAMYQPDSELKEILKNALWFLDGQITGETLYQRIGIELPKDEEKA